MFSGVAGPSRSTPLDRSQRRSPSVVMVSIGCSSGDPTASTGGVDCDGPNGCYNCKPTTPVQVLNACTDASCEPFANTKERLPLLNADGTLPPLP